MTKSKFMRVAAILMAAVLLTTCAISGTFAKYVTSGNATDSARVAKWGVTVTGTSNSAFSDTYAKKEASETSFENTVIAAEKVVAPGTDGSLAAFTLEGTPEVAVKVSFESTVTLEGWGEYCPIVFTVGEDALAQGEDTVADFAAKVKAAIEDYTAEYAAGTDLSAKTADAPAISWAWAFESGKDAEDTALGNLEVAPTISIATTCTVTQID